MANRDDDILARELAKIGTFGGFIAPLATGGFLAGTAGGSGVRLRRHWPRSSFQPKPVAKSLRLGLRQKKR
jgi:hypothetical protein